MTVGTEAKSNLVPNYLKASNPELLRGKMLENNLIKGLFIKYQDIQELKDGSWICWYYDEINFFAKIKNAKVK